MAETGVNYTVTVSKVGTGGAQAAAELNAVAAAARTTNETFTRTDITTAGLTKGFKAFSGVLTVAGLQTFPQLTAGVMVTKQALDGLRASGVQLTASAGLIGASIAGLTAIVLTGAQAWITYAAQKNEALTVKNLDAQTADFAERLRNQLVEANNAGRITNEQFEKLSRTLGSLSGNQQVRDFFQDLKRGSAGERIADFNRTTAFANAGNERDYPNQSKAMQALNIKMQYNAEQQLYNDLLQEGLITEKQYNDAVMEANTRQINSLNTLRGQLTELQQLGQNVAQTFSAGLATAIVSAFQKGGSAFKEFAAQFMAQIAQMILQMLIFKAISGLVGGALGGGFTTPMTFAQGGVRFAANGLAGVSAVNSATYFPKFNVVAGEAGREMLTVLARPRMMEVGGMQAVVGSAQGNRLAITSAEALAGRANGAGGTIVIQVQGTPEFEARLVSNSVKGAQVQIANDMRQDTPISRGVKGLTS